MKPDELLLHRALNRDMGKIAKYFKPGAKLTLLIRNPNFPKAGVLETDDDIELAIEEIRKLAGQPVFDSGEAVRQVVAHLRAIAATLDADREEVDYNEARNDLLALIGELEG